MAALELTATVSGAIAERIEAWFEAHEEAVVSIAEAPGAEPMFGEPGEPPPALWSVCAVSVCLPEDGAEALARAAEAALAVSFERVQRDDGPVDWLASFREQVVPLHFAGDLTVTPPWRAEEADGKVLVLEPDQAFGTGTHPTTRMCLDALPERAAGQRVLDYGAGSAILAMAAVRHGALAAHGVEIDPVAVDCARRNVDRNGLSDAVQLFLPDDAPDERYPLVLANILLNPLVVLAPRLAEAVAPGGEILMTGVLAQQLPALMAAYPAFTLREIAAETADGERWVLVSGRRTADA